MRDPAEHEAHDLPLAHRIMVKAIQDWLNTAVATAHAGNGSPPINDYERGFQQGIKQMRHLHLDNYWHVLVPKVMDEMRRAGLLVQQEPAST